MKLKEQLVKYFVEPFYIFTTDPVGARLYVGIFILSAVLGWIGRVYADKHPLYPANCAVCRQAQNPQQPRVLPTTLK